MIWPGMGDPAKRKKTLKFLGITAVIAISVGLASTAVQSYLNLDNPLYACTNDRQITHTITATLELEVDGERVEIPPGIGRESPACDKTMYSTGGGTIHADWIEEYPFEIGHFLWMWDFPLREMEQSKSAIYVDGTESPHFISHPLQDGLHYRAVFTTKAFDDSADRDFLPPDS
ncbi:MAG: hypothetical protein MPJ05_03370 [Nitrosopumilus sp.]|nr:hypothetical protein [Nitrosopumilus sp.]